MSIDELLCKFQGLEWHQRYDNTQRYRRPSPCTCGKQYTTVWNLKLHLKVANPDFSDDHTAMELLRWFFKEKEGMFIGFYDYMDIVAEDFILLKEVDGKQYMSWVVLLSEWLRLEETREKWGWEECPDKNIIGGLCITKKDSKCPVKEGDNCSGKIRSAWAREEE